MVEVELREWGNSVQIIGFGICRGAKSFEEETEEHREFW